MKDIFRLRAIDPTPIIDLRCFARSPYGWPGGYPMFAIMDDGGCVCHQCVLDNYRVIYRHTQADCRSDWTFVASEVNWEDEIYCDNCSEQIESAYGDNA
jgi:hypothetical protein